MTVDSLAAAIGLADTVADARALCDRLLLEHLRGCVIPALPLRPDLRADVRKTWGLDG